MTTHPTPRELAAFAAGTLKPEDTSVIQSHLDTCDACCRYLDARPDSLARVLRQHAGAGTVIPSRPPEVLAPPADTLENGAALSSTAEIDVPAELKNHARYRIVRLLGAGGMGAVYQAEHLLMKRTVALKVISQKFTTNPDAVQRFRREVEAASRLDHRNIVRALDAEQAGDTHFLVMEYIEGKSLAQVVAEKGPLSISPACGYIHQAAAGLQHAFERDLVHRDIKPHNMMLASDGSVRILDFGLARFVSDYKRRTILTDSATVMGTPDFMAPEQAVATHQADIRADIYSLGCTLYFLLAGSVPFPDGGPMQKLWAHTNQAPRPLAQLRPDIPPPLIVIVSRMMAKAPASRFQTPVEVMQALVPFLRSEEKSPNPPAPGEGKPPRAHSAGVPTGKAPRPGKTRQPGTVAPKKPTPTRPAVDQAKNKQWSAREKVLLAAVAGLIAIVIVAIPAGWVLTRQPPRTTEIPKETEVAQAAEPPKEKQLPQKAKPIVQDPPPPPSQNDRNELLKKELATQRENTRKAVEVFTTSSGKPTDIRLNLARLAEAAAQTQFTRADASVRDNTLMESTRTVASNSRDDATKTLTSVRLEIAKLESAAKVPETPLQRLERVTAEAGHRQDTVRYQREIVQNAWRALDIERTKKAIQEFDKAHTAAEEYLSEANLKAALGSYVLDVKAFRDLVAKDRSLVNKIRNELSRAEKGNDAPGDKTGKIALSPEARQKAFWEQATNLSIRTTFARSAAEQAWKSRNEKSTRKEIEDFDRIAAQCEKHLSDDSVKAMFGGTPVDLKVHRDSLISNRARADKIRVELEAAEKISGKKTTP